MELQIATLVERVIDLAIEEDLAGGDLASQCIEALRHNAKSIITAKAEGVVSGLTIAERVLQKISCNNYSFEAACKDGARVNKGDTIATLCAPYDKLLNAERLMLNFLQRMSGIATATQQMVTLLDGTKCRLLDTRKTAPGLRITDKMAVRHGGGFNHRMGLYDMAMLKDNHIKAAGGIGKAVAQARAKLPLSIKIEVETTTLQEVKEALIAGVDIIMLDNMSVDTMKEAVRMIQGKAKCEASGNITADTIREVARTGVDYISVGALTHSVKALDMSMNFES